MYVFINNNATRPVVDVQYIFAKYFSIRLGIALIDINCHAVIGLGTRKYLFWGLFSW